MSRTAHSSLVYLSAVHIRGFRNLDGRYPLSDPLSVIIGGNNTGKSNLIDACRALFSPEAGPRARHWITPEDFAHDGKGHRVADELELGAELADLDEAEQARMITCLSPKLGAGKARLRLRARIGAHNKIITEWLGGDSDRSDVERWARDAVSFTYLHPLRDAAADLRPGRANRLAHLLEALAPKEHPDRAAIETIMAQANEDLRAVSTIDDAASRIRDRFTAMTGHGSLSQESRLSFADPTFARVVATLRALAGQTHPLELEENGLGYNNLLYMAVLLAALAHGTEPGALRLLLVEEPEAHLHPQLQDLLMRYLEAQGREATQVVMTSHSPNFAAAARVERVTVLSRADDHAPIVGRRPADFGLAAREVRHLRRFLDVTKSGLLFAQGVILVEGVAEQLLLPILAEHLGRPLAASGVSVVNVGGVAFDPFVALFGAERLPYRCAVVTDADPETTESPDDETELDPAGVGVPDMAVSSRAARLAARTGANLLVRLATRTLEWDLVVAGNWDLMLTALEPLRGPTTRRLRRDGVTWSDVERADAFLAAIKKIKGEFAQSLADVVTEPAVDGANDDSDDDAPPRISIPDYLYEAVQWATESTTARAGGRSSPVPEPSTTPDTAPVRGETSRVAGDGR